MVVEPLGQGSFMYPLMAGKDDSLPDCLEEPLVDHPSLPESKVSSILATHPKVVEPEGVSEGALSPSPVGD